MKQNFYYIKFALQFADEQIDELVASFNREVNCRGWVGLRSYYDQALFDEFIRRGIEVSAVFDGHSISFARAVKYDIEKNRLVTDPDIPPTGRSSQAILV